MKSFASGLSFKETLGVLKNDIRQLHKFPSFFRVFTTASILYVAGSLVGQLRFIVGEYTPESEAEAKDRRAKERTMRMRHSMTDGERDLVVWQQQNEERVKRLVEDSK
jgi:hypothetical protein